MIVTPDSFTVLVIGICMGFAAGGYVAFVLYWLIMPGRPRKARSPARVPGRASRRAVVKG